MGDEQTYFDSIVKECRRAYRLAARARGKGFDPEDEVAIPIADDLAARVEGLVSIIFPQLMDSGLKERIRELEREYHKNDERVAFIIGKEVAEGRFYEFKSKEDAAEAGVRVAVAYLTLGVVTAPLEGISDVKIKRNPDGSEYLAVYYAGPIRSAGGTASALSVVAADYVRLALGLGRYKPEEVEILRYYTEVEDYYNRVAKKQYHPTKEEIEMIIKNVPVEMTGDPTEKLEVSNYKDLKRVETNRIRGGMCLVLLDGLPLKAEKLLKRIKKYGREFNLEHWFWLEKFIDLKHRIHGLNTSSSDDAASYIPSTKYLEKIVAGRPILAHPSRPGGFRLRYGRARTCGLAATAFSPATLHLVDFLAIGTQLALEAPGKATVVTVCDELEGPVVLLKDGSIVELRTKEDVEKYKGRVKKILSLGDILVPFGEFISNNHVLLPAAFTEEWWIEELKRALQSNRTCSVRVDAYLDRTHSPPSLEEAITISKELDVPLHPYYNFFWHDLEKEELKDLAIWFSEGVFDGHRLILPLDDRKKILEKLCAPCKLKKNKVFLDGKSLAAYLCLNKPNKSNINGILSTIEGSESVLEAIKNLSGIKLLPKGPTRLGAKMGRPEKAERRLMVGRPQILFPCGQQGGKTRNLIHAYELGYVNAEFPTYTCESCGENTHYRRCPFCGGKTKQLYTCVRCGTTTDMEEHCGAPAKPYAEMKVDLKRMLDLAAKNIGLDSLPDMFKGVRGVFGASKSVERLEKGLLRAKYGLYVNKDGTVRYDATDVPLTHFRPREVGVSVEKLRELGYTHDIHGNELTSEDQLLELMPQDIIISDNEDFSAADYFVNVAKFVDELLVKFYGTEPYYNVKTKKDLIGKLVIGLAPHTSAGIVGRIIGFTKARVCFAHPFWHAAKRRNADGDEDSIMLLMDALLNFSRKYLPATRGASTMDAPLVLTVRLNPEEIDDEAWNIDIEDSYPLEFYYDTLEYKMPNELRKRPKLVEDVLKDGVIHMKFTHDTNDINAGPLKTRYVLLKKMEDKIHAQLKVAEMIVAADENKVAEAVIVNHFLRDIKGNLRTFSRQTVRCVDCNEKYRRIPLAGKCLKCGGKLLLTVPEGAIRKYMEPTKSLMARYRVSSYVMQSFKLLERDIEFLFGKKGKQTNLFSISNSIHS